MQHTPVKRNNALDAVKVMATTLILFHHHQQVAGGTWPGFAVFFGNEFFYWGMMVELFFVISGFFAYRTLADADLPFGAYLGKKCSRLLPVAAVSTSVYCVLTYVHYLLKGKPWVFKDLPDVFGLIVSCLGLQKGFGFDGARLNNPTWFISVLLMCYICFYLIAYLAKKHHWKLEWILLMVIVITQNLLQKDCIAPFFRLDSLRGYQCFALGMLLGGFVAAYRVHQPLAGLCTVVMAVCIGFWIFAPAFIETRGSFVFLFCPALILLAQTKTAQKMFHHSTWGTLSAISFNVYVWHSTLQALLALIMPQIAFSQTIGGMLLFTLIAWFIGTLSHYFIERPLNNHLPKVWKWLFVRR